MVVVLLVGSGGSGRSGGGVGSVRYNTGSS